MDKFTLRQDEAVLMIIDIQERLVPAMKHGKKVIDNTNILINIAQKLNIPIIGTEQYPKGLGKTVPEISDNINTELFYEKVSFSGYIEEIKLALNDIGRKKVIITGMETHVCVFQTVRDLLDNGYYVFVAEDGVCSRTKENYLNGLLLMDKMGATIVNTETILFDLLKAAGTPVFKELSKLIK
ncbi:isochorismatase family protein [Proteiniborus sp. MB09-C3]|uniref:isochorismatase family protein n=1 Tax=Proteiniborus sp. MB09-C3 TaxID=3050072 RepID=UPI0025567206|nr:isochorismatase family protein [Proteiniborus sp. MB09-C3]WIV12642.1 isochorismatase family protein [Proteiniborus sp. MB09-C3]